ncbi:MAG: antibiotic biosynthesis monooxygenase [Acidimicrobiia bacterium]|nr:antibiotic biosynthesis monooxygenase [Acidimicrobiia bacterium]
MTFAAAPDPPYYAVIFANQHSGLDVEAYDRTAAEMQRLAAEQPGFLGIESARNADGFGITVSYWASREAIAAWKAHPDHQRAQAAGRSRWYDHYNTRIAKVE